MTIVRVHPHFDPTYYGFFWEGFRRLGYRPVLDATGFPAADTPGFYDFKDTFAALVDTPSGRRRLVISADDKADLRPAALEWADRVGKVNLLPGATEPYGDRLVAVGPTFGVRAWGPTGSLGTAATAWRRSPTSLRRQRRNRTYRDQMRRRVPEASYRPTVSDPDFLFFTAWPWTRHAEVNPPRAEFIRACQRQTGAEFVGGFAPRRRGNPEEFAGLYAPGKYPLDHYLQLVGRSAVAFNNPAVHGCLGWKLGEFLGMGKAIISLPLGRELPEELEDGVNVVLVDGSAAALDEAIGKVRADASHRRLLEQGARAYYERWLLPEVLMSRLLEGWR